MVKLITLLMLGTSLFFASFKEYFINVDAICYEEKDGIKYLYDDEYKIIYQDITIYENEVYEDLSFCLIDNYIYVLFKSSEIVTINKYSLSGNLVKSVNLFNIYEGIKITNIDNKLYLYGGIKINDLINESAKEENDLKEVDKELLSLIIEDEYLGVDGFLLELSSELNILNLDIYKGRSDEQFIDLYFFDDTFLIYGKKGTNSGGIYGNGGIEGANYVLSLDNQFKQIFNENVLNIKKIDEKYIIVTNNGIYLFNGDNSPISSLKMPLEALFGYITDNFTCLVICQNKGYFFDLRDFSIIYEFDYFGYDYVCFSDYLYFKKEEKAYVLDIANLSNFYTKTYYGSFDNPRIIEGLYGKYVLDEVSYDNFFSPSVYGEYNCHYLYKQNDLDITFDSIKCVDKQVNVTEGMIYPVGYHLLFTGKGYLNGKIINQNEELTLEGKNVLKIVGIDSSEDISFQVDKNQSRFIDNMYSDYDYVAYIGTNINIYLDSDANIDKVYVNDLEYDVKLDDDKKYISVMVLSGINSYLVSGGEITYNDIKKIVPLNYYFKVLGIINNEVDLGISVAKKSENVRIDTFFNKGGEALRCIILKINEEMIYYPLESSEIRLDKNINNGDKFSLYLGLYNGSSSLDLVKLFDGNINGNNDKLFDVYITEKQEYINEISFDVSYNGIVNNIEFNDYYIDFNKDSDNSFIIICVIISIISFGLIVLIRRKKRRLKK